MSRKAYVTLALAAAITVACGERADTPDTNGAPPPAPPAASTVPTVELPPGITQDMVAQGQQLFGGQAICFSCHGGDGQGSVLGPALNDSEWLQIDGSFEQISNVIRVGVPNPVQYPGTMPAMGGTQLTDDQIQAISAYVYAISRS